MDKRIIKTRAAVFNAVFDLSAEKGLDKITVIELCEKANINKSTFYLHYDNIEDCYSKCFSFVTERILKLAENINYTDVALSPEKTVDEFLDAVENNMDLIMKFKSSALYDSAVSQLKRKFLEALCEVNHLNINSNYHQVTKMTFLVGGCLDSVTQNLPAFDKNELRKILVDAIKRKV